MNNPDRIYLYKRYERFWHWSQAALIILMMITGFEVHGTYNLVGFGKAVSYHTLFAWTLLTLWAFHHLLAIHHRRMAAIHPDAEEGGCHGALLRLRDIPQCTDPVP